MTQYLRKDRPTAETGVQTSTEFNAISGKRDPHYGRPMATVEYHHPTEKPNFTAYGDRYVTTLATRDKDPSELFSNKPGMVTGAFADPSMRQHIPTLLGMTANLSHQLTGSHVLPMPDSSLSRHSSPMVQKLRAKGVDFPDNPKNPTAGISNNIRMTGIHAPDVLLEQGSYGDEVSHADVQAGKSTIRGLLRGPKDPHPAVAASPQFKQQHLFLGSGLHPNPRAAPGWKPQNAGQVLSNHP